MARPFRYESAAQKTTYQAGDISKDKQVSLSKKRGKKYGYIAKHDFYELYLRIVSIRAQQSVYHDNILNISFSLCFLWFSIYLYID